MIINFKLVLVVLAIFFFQTYSIAQNALVQSVDYALTEQSINQSILNEDKEALRLALKTRFLSLKIIVVEELNKLDDKGSILHLIQALKSNDITIGGGIEISIMQRNLTISIIEALQKLTKLNFGITETLSRTEIDKVIKTDRVIKESQEWWEKHKNEFR